MAQRPSKRASLSVNSDVLNGEAPSNADHLAKAVEAAAQINRGKAEDSSGPVEGASSPPVKATPKSWADLVRTKAAPTAFTKAQVTIDDPAHTNGLIPAKTGSLADALSSYNVKDSSDFAKVAFLEPRGLVNTGNMCYMNSVSLCLVLAFRDKSLTRNQILQILVFCVPFYNFLENIGTQAAHSFKSDTPLMDAM